MAPDSIEFEEINMNGAWQQKHAPKNNPRLKPFVAVSAEYTPRFVITTKTQRISMDFKVGSQVFVNGSTFRYKKGNVLKTSTEYL